MPASSEDQHIVVVNEVIASVKGQSALLHPLSDKCCIYRVPDRLRKQNEEAYTPHVVSIGPIHHEREELKSMHHKREGLKSMEEHKRRYLERFLSLRMATLEDCVKLVAENETRLRNCYAETVELDSKELTEVMLVDAVFILMVLLRSYFGPESPFSSKGDRIFGNPEMIYDVKYDMLLLENQLPYFIVENLFESSRIKDLLLERQLDITMEDLALSFFRRRINDLNIPAAAKVEEGNSAKAGHLLDRLRTCLLPSYRNTKRDRVITRNAVGKEEEKGNSSKAKHLLDLFRTCVLPSERNTERDRVITCNTDAEEEEEGNSAKAGHLLDRLRTCLLSSCRNPERDTVITCNAPSVTELHQSGVKFQAVPKGNMFDIKFDDGILKIPQFKIEDGTEMLFRNLLAFEQCHGLPGYFSDYISIMGEIIKTPKDVHLLVGNEILEDWNSNSDDASKLFRNLGNGVKVDFSSCKYASLMGKLNKHVYQSLWPKWKASLKRDYFKAPWAIFSVVAAIILLVLTVIQTVCSVLQVS